MKKKQTSNLRAEVLFTVFWIFLFRGSLLSAELSVTGVIRAQEEVVVRSEFAGIVQRIAVKEGERVREGQLLVELKNERHRISLDLSRARLEKTNASVSETKVLLENAKKDLARVEKAGDAVPRKDLEDKADQVLRLQAILQAQDAESAQAREEVRLRENEVKETRLSAPFSGTVTQIYINRGDTLKPTETQVLELVALDRLYAEVLLPVAHVQDAAVATARAREREQTNEVPDRVGVVRDQVTERGRRSAPPR